MGPDFRRRGSEDPEPLDVDRQEGHALALGRISEISIKPRHRREEVQAGIEECRVQRGIDLFLAGRQGDPAKGGTGAQIQLSNIPERCPVVQTQMVEAGIKGADIHGFRAVPSQRGKVRRRQTAVPEDVAMLPSVSSTAAGSSGISIWSSRSSPSASRQAWR